MVSSCAQVPSKWQKHIKQKMPKQDIKEATKKAKRAKVCVLQPWIHSIPDTRWFQLDPANQKTTLDVLREAEAFHEAKSALANGTSKGKGKRKADELDSDDDASDVSVSESPARVAADVPIGSGSITELRSKLHERIAALQLKTGRRKPGEEPAGEGETEGEMTDGMPGTKDELLEMRRRRRGEVREKRRKETKERKAKERAERDGKSKVKERLVAPAPVSVTGALNKILFSLF